MSPPLKPLEELIAPDETLSSRVQGSPRVAAPTADSRRVVPGGIFFAIRGTAGDGHSHLDQAAANGAAVLVVEDPAAAAGPGTVLVKSTRRALALACHRWHARPSEAFELVAITGTNGKTTSAHLFEQVWTGMGLRAGRIGTVEYKIGDLIRESQLTTPDPETLQALFAEMRGAGVAHVAMEVSSIALAQDRITGSVVDAALFTNLTQDHLDYHGDIETYFGAKRVLFTDLAPRVAVVCVEDAYGRRLADELGGRAVTFALTEPADFRVEELSTDRSETRARVRGPGGELDLRLRLLGRHNVLNALGVLATCHALGLEDRGVAERLSRAAGAPGRLERVEGLPEHAPTVFVDYAHTPDALSNVVGLLAEIRRRHGGELITVFGCGGDRDRTKRPEMAAAVSRASDVTIATSDNPRREDPERILDDIEKGIDRSRTRYRRRVDRAGAIAEALRMARPGDWVLIAGKGHETYQILSTGKIDFDDRVVVREYYSSKG